MNKEQTKEAIKVMQAFVDGKEIEVCKKTNEIWKPVDYPTERPIWDFDKYEYRIKPESKYRPYANAEECFADVKKHGGWVKNTDTIYMITTIESCGVSNDTLLRNFDELVKIYVWADDGSPCGVKEE